MTATSIRLLGIYSGMVFFIICVTVLALQSITDCIDHRIQYRNLYRMGVEEAKSVWYFIFCIRIITYPRKKKIITNLIRENQYRTVHIKKIVDTRENWRDLPRLAMTISDYNDMRKMAGFETIELADDQFFNNFCPCDISLHTFHTDRNNAL